MYLLFSEFEAERPIPFARSLAGFNTAHKTHGVHRVAAEIRTFLEQPKAMRIGEERPVQAGRLARDLLRSTKFTVDPSRFSFKSATHRIERRSPDKQGSGLEG